MSMHEEGSRVVCSTLEVTMQVIMALPCIPVQSWPRSPGGGGTPWPVKYGGVLSPEEFAQGDCHNPSL